MGIRFDQTSQSVTEGDVVTILITADHIAVESITIMLELTPLTASGTVTRVVRIQNISTYYYYFIIDMI